MVVSNIFHFHPYLGKIANLTNIFQMGWNHQLVIYIHFIYLFILVGWSLYWIYLPLESWVRSPRNVHLSSSHIGMLTLCHWNPARWAPSRSLQMESHGASINGLEYMGFTVFFFHPKKVELKIVKLITYNPTYNWWLWGPPTAGGVFFGKQEVCVGLWMDPMSAQLLGCQRPPPGLRWPTALYVWASWQGDTRHTWRPWQLCSCATHLTVRAYQLPSLKLTYCWWKKSG